MTTNQNSTAILREEIIIDARRTGEEIIIRAGQDAENYLTSAAAEAERERQEHLDRARAEAARRSELILATVSVETGRLKAARIEALLESVHEEVRRRLLAREGFVYRETVIFLAAHAISRMTGDTFVVKVPEEDYTVFGNSLADEIAQSAGRPVGITISYEPDITDGVFIEDAEARQVWDNRFVKRLERLWPELRQQIAVQAAFVPANINIDVVKTVDSI